MISISSLPAVSSPALQAFNNCVALGDRESFSVGCTTRGNLSGSVQYIEAQDEARLPTWDLLTSCRRPGGIVGNEHADHSLLPGGDEQLAVPAAADMQVGPGGALAHGLLDQIAK